ncbi:MAG: ribosome maturation factor RimM [Clostridia bacterium]
MEKYLEIGQIVGTHGIQGELKLETWTDSPDFLKKIKNLYFDKGAKNAGLVSSRVHKNLLLITLDGVDCATKAELLRGTLMYMDRADAKLPKDRFFIADLIGLKVYDGNTKDFYGTIAEVFQTGANNVYRIEKDGKDYLFPAVDAMIKSTDIEKEIIEVLPIQGIFDGQEISDEN